MANLKHPSDAFTLEGCLAQREGFAPCAARTVDSKFNCCQVCDRHADFPPLKPSELTHKIARPPTKVNRRAMAQREGFEPPYVFLRNTISSRARSTTPPSLQVYSAIFKSG